MKSLRMFCGVLFLVLACCLLGCPGCGEPAGETFARLLVDPPRLIFTDLSSASEESALIFLEDSQASATIESIKLEGSAAFRLLTKFKTPFRLEGGRANGVKIEIGFTPDGSELHKGHVRILCPDCFPVKEMRLDLLLDNGKPLIFSANPVWACGGTLDFGNVDAVNSSRKRCKLTNTGDLDLKIDGHQYQHKSGDAKAFTWLAPMGSFVVKAGDPQGVEVELEFSPRDPSLSPTSGAFVLSTRTPLSLKGPLQLNVTGNQVLPQPKIELVPRYPTCTDDSTCRTIDNRLSCVKDDFSGATICRTSESGKPLLKFPLTSKGKTTKRTFFIRNPGTSALKVEKLSFDLRSSKDFKVITEGLNFPLVLEPKQEKEITVEYAPSDAQEDTGTLVAISDAAGAPNAEMLVEVSNRGCNIDVQPRKLEFAGSDVKQVTIVNLGNEACLVKKVFLKSAMFEPFALLPAPQPNQVLAPNASISFLVKFSHSQNNGNVDLLVIESDDPDEPNIEVYLGGGGRELGPCELDVTPSTLNFGLVPVGRSRKSAVTLNNKGFGDCEVASINVLGTNPAGHGAFQLTTAIQLPFKIASGSNLRLDVDYTPPAERSGYEGKLEIQSNDNVNPNYVVKLVGNSGTLCLEVVPPSLDFGSTKFGCATTSRSIEVFNLGAAKCASSIAVTGIQLAGNPNGEFRTDSAPAVPVTLTLGQSIKVEMAYKAKDLGVDTATLEILNSVPGQSPLVLPLLGEGLNESDQKDVFTQASRPQADIMFIIDNSSSVHGEQANIAANLKSMFAWLLQVGVDYQVMVTTTDVTGVGGGAGCAQGAVKIVTSSTPDPEATLRANALVGTSGSASEKGLEAAYRALLPPAITTCNRGFLRPSAALSLVFVSDEEDQSPQSVAFYLAFFRSLKGTHRTDLLRASAIVGPPPNGCQGMDLVGAGAGQRYWDVAKELNGVQASICEADWASILSQVSAVGAALKRQFFLSRAADAATIVVKVNQQVVKEDVQDGWQYDSTSNSVLFASSATPAGGAVVEVQYQAQCLP